MKFVIPRLAQLYASRDGLIVFSIATVLPGLISPLVLLEKITFPITHMALSIYVLALAVFVEDLQRRESGRLRLATLLGMMFVSSLYFVCDVGERSGVLPPGLGLAVLSVALYLSFVPASNIFRLVLRLFCIIAFHVVLILLANSVQLGYIPWVVAMLGVFLGLYGCGAIAASDGGMLEARGIKRCGIRVGKQGDETRVPRGNSLVIAMFTMFLPAAFMGGAALRYIPVWFIVAAVLIVRGAKLCGAYVNEDDINKDLQKGFLELYLLSGAATAVSSWLL